MVLVLVEIDDRRILARSKTRLEGKMWPLKHVKQLRSCFSDVTSLIPEC